MTAKTPAGDAAVTRGYGLLERFLARQRARTADRLIPAGHREGRILDIGCGSFPYFLANTRFAERYGLDKLTGGRRASAPELDGVTLVAHDLEAAPVLPFESGYFDVVSMLAVFEHIEPAVLRTTLAEIRRILRPGGSYILTTPAGWTDPLLRTLARLGLVSAEEIEEHKDAYDHGRIAAMLEEAGFARDAMDFGSFELGMNLWATARK